jgi:sugar (pentulose or hexulose) kinase
MKIDMLDMDSLTAAHKRAVDAVRFNIPKCSEQDADEIVTAIVALVFETLKQYLPGEDTCN